MKKGWLNSEDVGHLFKISNDYALLSHFVSDGEAEYAMFFMISRKGDWHYREGFMDFFNDGWAVETCKRLT